MTARPLKWRKPKDDGQDFGREGAAWLADGIGGIYAVEADGLLWWAHDPFQWKRFGSVSAAKDAAEDDWQQAYARHAAPPKGEA
ncbi:hypothetical protein [Roseixanthobacter pseudopolyaromaticivorans]|uniref:hypothetical protein n=1 Tax=Xanthobacteraceae TaxID=335928 RepID=UPI003727E9C5